MSIFLQRPVLKGAMRASFIIGDLALVALGTLVGGGRSVAAQTPDSAVPTAGPPAAALAAAAQTITAAELTRHFTALLSGGTPDTSHFSSNRPDSLSYPSRARAWQEHAAKYIAGQWQPLGLVSTFPPLRGGVVPAASELRVQRAIAPGQRRLRYDESRLILNTVRSPSRPPIRDESGSEVGQDWTALVPLSTDAHFVPEAGRSIVRETFVRSLMIEDPDDYAVGSRRTMLVAGPHTAATLRALGPSTFASAVVFYVPPTGIDPATRQAVLTELYRTSRGVIVVSEADSTTFARELEAAKQTPVTVIDHYLLETIANRREWPWVVAVRQAAVMPHFWAAAGIEPAAMRTQTTPLTRELTGTDAWLMAMLEQDTVSAAADTLGLVRSGGDSTTVAPLTYPYVLGFLEGTDSVLKRQTVVVTASLGAPSAQAAELAGLLALARAFSASEVRPRRSVLFVAAGGEPPEHAGSWLIAEETANGGAVAALTLEHVGASASVRADNRTGATLVVDGGPDVVLPRTPTWVAATRPELGLEVVDTGTVFRPETAALAFATHLVPSVRLSVGDVETTPDAAVRAVRFAWYLTAMLANAPERSRWTVAGRQRYFAMRRLQPLP